MVDVFAQGYGFESFEQMLQDERLSDIVIIGEAKRDDQKLYLYKGVPHPDVEHITRQMRVTQEDVHAR